MKSEYKRDMNHNYLILTGEDAIDTNSYQVRMIVANAVPDLLQCRIQGIDGKFMVYYDVTSRHSMTALFEEKKIGMEELQVILGGFVQVMEAMSEYLLNPCQLILEPEYIYLDAEKQNVRFCYLPGFHGEIQKQFQNLAEYILPKLDHEDGKAVMLGYGVYRRALEDSFHLEYIKEELYKVRNGETSDFAVYEKKKPLKQAEKSQEEHKEQEELWQMENWNREDLDGVEKKKKDSKPNNREVKKENRDRLWKTAGFLLALLILLGITAGMAAGYLPRVSTGVFLSVILGLMVLGMLSYILMKKIPEKKQNPHEETDRIRDFQEKNIYEIPQEKEKQPEIKEHEVSEENTECFGETVVLSAGITKGPATLVSHEPGELATIYLDRDITVIGKLETAADAVINMPTVSRIHAKIRKRDGEYYLTDLNSRNGTSVNGQILKNGEDRLLEDEDEVDFAQARYIFLK
mgnify:FL=1